MRDELWASVSNENWLTRDRETESENQSLSFVATQTPKIF